jgi:hypothetical protein
MVISIGRGSTVGFENVISVMPAYSVSQRELFGQIDPLPCSFMALLCSTGTPSEVFFPQTKVVSFQISGTNILTVKFAMTLGRSKMGKRSDGSFMMMELWLVLACIVRLVLCSVFLCGWTLKRKVELNEYSRFL